MHRNMKKQIITLGLIFITGLVFAQNPIEKGQGQFNAGLGFSSWGVPVYLGFDIGVHRDITVGGELSLRFYDDRYRDVYYNQSIIGLVSNGNYHFNTLLKIPKNWDFYAGLNLGFYIWNNENDYAGPHSSGLELGAQVGGRYYFNNKFGLNLELGGSNSFSGGKFGISVRL
jgi:outer membrane immunogenic protein